MPERTVKRRNRPNLYPDEQLRDAAAEVFLERGYADASMVEIAAKAGVTKPTLYSRFGSKAQLYDQVLEALAESLIEQMGAAYSGARTATAEEAAERSSRAFFDWVRDRPTGARLLLADGQGAPTGIDHRARALEALTQVVAEASTDFLQARGVPAQPATGLLAAYFVGIFHQGALWTIEHDAVDRVDVGDFTARFMLGGLHGVTPGTIAAVADRRSPS